MAMLPVYSLKDFTWLLDDLPTYPFYGILLYTPLNGLDVRLHEYVRSHWHFINRLTGESCQLLALEDVEAGRSIEQFKPEEVYDIARSLGVSVQDVPSVVFFVEPKTRSESVVIKLSEFLTDPRALTDDELTDFFRSISAILDSCSKKGPNERLKCLHEGLGKQWPSDSKWFSVAFRASQGLAKAVSIGAPIAQSVASVLSKIL